MHDIRRPGWWERNWKWCVPVLCLAFAGLVLAGAFGLVAFVMGMMRSSDPYQHALQRARTDPAVIAALGTPIETGFFTSGEISSAGGDGKAHLAIPLQGAMGHATLYVDADETAGVWHYSVIAVAVDANGRRIDLLGAGDR